jgi:hypothetical protein
MTTQPVQTIRDGALKATIWKNKGGKGEFYSVQFSRLYQDAEGHYQEAQTFSGLELLRLGRLARIAYSDILRISKGGAL